MNELFDKEVNAQKESLKNTSGVHASSRMPTKRCAMKMKETNKQRNKKKNDGRLKYFCGEEGVYKARAEKWCHGYQTTSDHRFFIH